jgi:2',3'-cyclic-nucleotide 2'-phosphodiesterase (5'-nucleotidase family)
VAHPRVAHRLLVGLLIANSAAAEIRPLTVLHTNDLHARLTPLDNGNGGFAYFAGVLRREREGCGHCIFVSGGDLVQGSPVSTLFRGMPVFEIANLFAFDAATFGNHDFDYGWRATEQYMAKARYPIVSANLVDSRGRLFTRKPFAILKAGGLRVAVIGAMTADLPQLTKAEARGPWRAVAVTEAVRKHLPAALASSDAVIVLGHLNPAEEQEVLEKTPEVAAVISGHSHRGLQEPLRRGERLMVRVKSYGEELGRLDMQIDTVAKAPVKSAWRIIPVNSKNAPYAADVGNMVKRWENEVAKVVDVPIGESRRELSRREVKLLIERAMRDTLHSDFALMNSGGVRDILPRGAILKRHVWNIMPFDNAVVIGKFPGARLPRSLVNGRAVEPNREYTLAVTDFTAEAQGDPEGLGGGGFVFSKDGPLLRDLLIDWIAKKKVIDGP